MKRRRPAQYNGVVLVRTWLHAIAAAAFATTFAFILGSAPAGADPSLVPVGPSPIVNVFVRRGHVLVRTWNRPQIAVNGVTDTRYLTPQQLASKLPQQLPARAASIRTPDGVVSLPPEAFVLPPFSAAPHDAVIVHGDGDVVLDVPATTALLVVRVGGGHITLQNFRGTFYAMIRGGGITLRNDAGTGFVEALRGGIWATDSTFDRLRARTAVANMFFERCTAQQIVATSVSGSIVYDNGSFVPGLARFESQQGNVALGIGNGGARIGAHSGAGRIVADFTNRANYINRTNDASATVGGGGATVTASSGSGSVLLYDGSLRAHQSLVAGLPKMREFVDRRFKRRPPAPTPRNIGARPRRAQPKPPHPRKHPL